MRTATNLHRVYAALLAALLMAALPMHAQAQQAPLQGDPIVTEARDALRRHDAARLAAAKAAAFTEHHPLAMWVDYWELSNRLQDAQLDEVEAFYKRWSGAYVEDRLRNDWLLELGRRRDWADFARDYPRFRMNDDREVSCYALLTQHLSGTSVVDAARAAWLAQRDVDDGCSLLITTLNQAGLLREADIWREARLAAEYNRPRMARFATVLIDPSIAAASSELFDNPARYLTRKGSARDRAHAELTAMALMRMAVNDPQATAALLESRWERTLPADLAAHVWAIVGKQAALKLLPETTAYNQRAWGLVKRKNLTPQWTDDLLAWQARAALRAEQDPTRWAQVLRAIQFMSPTEGRDPTWVYWQARALAATARDGEPGASQRAQSVDILVTIADQFGFYGKLAAEELGQPLLLPSKPAPLSTAERSAAATTPGLNRGLQLIALGLRPEGVREWNYTLRGMGDRELLAAAQMACDREVWDRCIHASERTRTEIDLNQRFPTPFRESLLARTREFGLDPAYVYGLIRQESRFVTNARSSVGAAGLMQLMPGTARWTAKKLGFSVTPDMLNDHNVNMKLGTGYLKLVLDSFDGSQAMGAAAYNAGPNRLRRWRDGPVLDAVVWTENIPFTETRDYVKRVLWNATYYAALLTNQPVSLRARLGRFIGPGNADAGSVDNKDLP